MKKYEIIYAQDIPHCKGQLAHAQVIDDEQGRSLPT